MKCSRIDVWYFISLLVNMLEKDFPILCYKF